MGQIELIALLTFTSLLGCYLKAKKRGAFITDMLWKGQPDV